MPFVDSRGARIHWQERGQGSPVLLVMGHLFSSAMWYPMIPALAAEHRVIWFDNRGTGESSAPSKFTVGDMARDAFAVMNAAGVPAAHVFGMSMGGVIVIEMALQAPQRVTSLIVGCSGILTVDKPRAPRIVRLLYRLPRWLLNMLLRGRRGEHGYGSAAAPDLVATDKAMVAKDKSDMRGVAAQAVAVAAHVATREDVATLHMPSLVLHGDEDATVRFAWGEELAETLPHSRFVRLPGAGHNFLIAAGEAARAAVLGFLREVDQSPTGTLAVPGSAARSR